MPKAHSGLLYLQDIVVVNYVDNWIVYHLKRPFGTW